MPGSPLTRLIAATSSTATPVDGNASGATLVLGLALIVQTEGGLLLEDGNGKGKGLLKEPGNSGNAPGKIKKERPQSGTAEGQLIGGGLGVQFTTAGLASGTAAASGATLTATASLTEGTGSGSATASGTTETVTASLTAGTASVGAEASGATLTITHSLIAGTGEVNAEASGATLTILADYGDGVLLGEDGGEFDLEDGSGGGLLIQPYAPAAEATGTANATGVTLTVTGSLVEGAGSGVRNAEASGETLSVTASLTAGTATGGAAGDGEATGATLTLTASLTAGAATGQSATRAGGGSGRVRGIRWTKDAAHGGAVLRLRLDLLPGRATGTRTETAEPSVVVPFTPRVAAPPPVAPEVTEPVTLPARPARRPAANDSIVAMMIAAGDKW